MVRRPRDSPPLRRSWPPWQHRRRGAVHPYRQGRGTCARDRPSPPQHLLRLPGAARGLVQRGPAALVLGAAGRRMRSSVDGDLSTAAGASRRGPGTQRRASVRRHGCRPRPRLERDSTSWPRRSEVRGTWRTSKFDGPTDWCDGHKEAAQRELYLTSQARQGSGAAPAIWCQDPGAILAGRQSGRAYRNSVAPFSGLVQSAGAARP
jgi:hypothetical protein